MSFGTRIRGLRSESQYTLRPLAKLVSVDYTYLSKIENDKLKDSRNFTQALVHKLVAVLNAEEDELTLLTDRVPESIRRWICERPDAFKAFDKCDDKTLGKLLIKIAHD